MKKMPVLKDRFKVWLGNRFGPADPFFAGEGISGFFDQKLKTAISVQLFYA